MTTNVIDDCHFCGSIGTLIDELPLLTHAHVRPYIIAIVLHRNAVRFSEVISSISPHSSIADLRISDDYDEIGFEKTRLELLVEEVLGEMVAEGILRYNETKDIWVLSPGDKKQHIPKIISWVCTLGAQLPHHLALELAANPFNAERISSRNFQEKRAT